MSPFCNDTVLTCKTILADCNKHKLYLELQWIIKEIKFISVECFYRYIFQKYTYNHPPYKTMSLSHLGRLIWHNCCYILSPTTTSDLLYYYYITLLLLLLLQLDNPILGPSLVSPPPDFPVSCNFSSLQSLAVLLLFTMSEILYCMISPAFHVPHLQNVAPFLGRIRQAEKWEFCKYVEYSSVNNNEVIFVFCNYFWGCSYTRH